MDKPELIGAVAGSGILAGFFGTLRKFWKLEAHFADHVTEDQRRFARIDEVLDVIQHDVKELLKR